MIIPSYTYITQLVLSIATIFLLSTCATPPFTAGEGGKKDTKPPKVVYSKPYQGQLNFKKRTIRIRFDEKINISKLKDKIVISPYVGKDFEIRTSGKTLVLTLPKNYQQYDTTGKTYNINFTTGIVDLREGNALNGYQLVFCSGNTIDSLTLYGTVKDAFSLTPMKDILVGLYSTQDTIIPVNTYPRYFTYTNAFGQYLLKYLPLDTFKIFAFNDANKDLLYQPDKERLSFRDSLYNTTTTPDSVMLLLSRNDIKKPFIKNIKNDQDIKLNLSEGIYLLTITSEEQILHQFNNSRNELSIYKTNYCEDSIKVKLDVLDSALNDTSFTIMIAYTQPKKSTLYQDVIKNILPKPGILSSPDTLNFQIETHLPLLIDKDTSLIITTDSLYFQYLRITRDLHYNTTKTLWTYSQPIKRKPKRFIQILIPPKSLTTITPDTNPAYNIKYKLSPEPKTKASKPDEDVTEINLTIVNEKGHNIIVQILDQKNNEIKSYTNPTKINYQRIKPGKYSIRVIYDSNKNGKWDAGNFKRKEQPEKVKIFKELIVVKENWDIEEQTIQIE